MVSYANSHWYERTVFFSQSSKWETKNTKLAGKWSRLLHLLWLTTCSKTSSFQIRKSMSNNLKENWISGLTQGYFSFLFLIPLFIYLSENSWFYDGFLFICFKGIIPPLFAVCKFEFIVSPLWVCNMIPIQVKSCVKPPTSRCYRGTWSTEMWDGRL